MADVVYKPVSLPDQADINAPKEIDKPEYEDVGVAYKNYSKTALGGGQYKLNPQQPFDANFLTTYVGGETGSNYTLGTDTSKTYYLTDLFLSVWPNSVNNIRFSDASGRIFYYQINDNFTIPVTTMHFTIPIKLSSNVVTMTLSAAAAASDAYAVNFYGWTE